MTPSIQTILLPIDFSPCSLRAIAPATSLAAVCRARLVLFNVVEVRSSTAPPFYFSIPPPLELEKDLSDISRKHLETLAANIRNSPGMQVETHVVSGTPYREIGRHADEIKADMIVMGTHGASGLNEFFVGTNAARVVNKSHCPVITIPDRELGGFGAIVVPLPGSEPGEATLNFAAMLARACGATIHLLPVSEKMTSYAAEMLRGRFERENVNCITVRIGGSFRTRQVLNYAAEVKAGLLVIERHAEEGFLADYFTGAFAQQVVNHSRVPVLTVPPLDATVGTHGIGEEEKRVAHGE